jgi:hypothetical protein
VICPFCKKELAGGSTVCESCGAYMEKKNPGCLAILTLVFCILGLYLGGVVCVYTSGIGYAPLISFFGLLIACGLVAITYRLLPTKSVWVQKR